VQARTQKTRYPLLITRDMGHGFLEPSMFQNPEGRLQLLPEPDPRALTRETRRAPGTSRPGVLERDLGVRKDVAVTERVHPGQFRRQLHTNVFNNPY